MKKLLVIVILAALAYSFVQEYRPAVTDSGYSAQNTDSVLQEAFDKGQSDIQVRGQGRVSRILKDDTEGSRHQRFIMKLNSGQSILVSHNIDLAPRVAGLRQGDTLEFFGEYEWNHKGGVIHWTHHDPAGRHVGGWIKHAGKTYQ